MYIYSFKFFLQVFKIGMDQRQIFLSPEFLFSILYGCLILVECNQPACCQLAEELFGMASAAQGGIYIDTFRMYIESIHCFFQSNGFMPEHSFTPYRSKSIKSSAMSSKFSSDSE